MIKDVEAAFPMLPLQCHRPPEHVEGSSKGRPHGLSSLEYVHQTQNVMSALWNTGTNAVTPELLLLKAECACGLNLGFRSHTRR